MLTTPTPHISAKPGDFGKTVLMPGDLIFDTAVNDPDTLQKGDIITYWTIINGERVLNTHTIHEIYDGGGYLIFATKGDNNTAADPLTVHESEIVSQYAFRVPAWVSSLTTSRPVQAS